MSKEKIKRQLKYYKEMESSLIFKIKKEQNGIPTDHQAEKIKRLNKVIVSLSKEYFSKNE